MLILWFSLIRFNGTQDLKIYSHAHSPILSHQILVFDSKVTVYTHTHTLTHSLSLVLVVMTWSTEFKTSRSILIQFSLILSHQHSALYLLLWWDQRNSRPQDLFSCWFCSILSLETIAASLDTISGCLNRDLLCSGWHASHLWLCAHRGWAQAGNNAEVAAVHAV